MLLSSTRTLLAGARRAVRLSCARVEPSRASAAPLTPPVFAGAVAHAHSSHHSSLWDQVADGAKAHPSREFTKHAQRVIVKVGTAVLQPAEGYQHHIALGRLGVLVEQLAGLVANGQQPILVTSGAIGIGRQRLRNHQLISRPIQELRRMNTQGIDDKASASAGQAVLMSLYDRLFQNLDCMSSQVLLTDNDFKNRDFRRTLRHTITSLLDMNVIPIVNENDAVYALKPEQQDMNFWDNDSLAALLAQELDAELVVLLSNVDGVFTGPPEDPTSELIHTWCPDIHESLIKYGSKSSVGRGGMTAKVQAAWSAAQAGCPVIIASGKNHDSIGSIMRGELVGTLFDQRAAAAFKAEQSALRKAGGSARDLAISARTASRKLQDLDGEQRKKVLLRLADALESNMETILEANAEDVMEARGKIDNQMLQRLILKPEKFKLLSAGTRAIANMADPIGKVVKHREIADGLRLEQVTSPIGVLLVIFEARPDALPQIASLALRSGNGLLLKGGKEARRTNQALLQVIREAIRPEVDPDTIHLVETRAGVSELLKLDDVIDLVIPRGSNELVQHIQQNTRIPVLGHADGVCHMYIDENADLEMACKLAVDSKIDYPAACNAMETLLVHEKMVTNGSITKIISELQAAGVELYGGDVAAKHLGLKPCPAKHHEYGDLAATVEIVPDMDAAIDYIHEHGSSHTECIITEDTESAEQFLRRVDSACVFHNASTRFGDGYRFGQGAEVGVSTCRIHARGPVGVDGLLTTRWLLRGNGHAVEKDKKIKYTHKELPLPESSS